MVCHDILIAPMFVDLAVLMAAGKVLAAGSPASVLAPEALAAALGTRVQVSWAGDGSLRATFG
jgi:iron complex transport system ATP-binding protein